MLPYKALIHAHVQFSMSTCLLLACHVPIASSPVALGFLCLIDGFLRWMLSFLLQVVNRSALHWQLHASIGGAVLDDLWLTKSNVV